jgi:hypothetical protein
MGVTGPNQDVIRWNVSHLSPHPVTEYRGEAQEIDSDESHVRFPTFDHHSSRVEVA